MRAFIRQGKLLKWWHGYLLTQGVDHFTGLPLEPPTASQRTSTSTCTTRRRREGDQPRSAGCRYFVTADMGHSSGVLRVERRAWDHAGRALPPGDALAPRKAQATLDFDEHGVPFCRHCGGGTDQVSFMLLPAEGPKGRHAHLARALRRAPGQGVRGRAGDQLPA